MNTQLNPNTTIKSRPLNLLILEDNIDDLDLLIINLEEAGLTFNWQAISTIEDFKKAISLPIDVIIADYTLPKFTALDALTILQETEYDIPFIIVTGSISEEVAVTSLQNGAADYLLKDRLSRLAQSILLAVEKHDLRQAQKRTQEKFEAIFNSSLEIILLVDKNYGLIIDASPAIHTILGYEADTLIGKHVSYLLASDKFEDLQSIPSSFIHSTLYSEYFRHANQSLIPMDVKITNLFKQDASILLMTIRDGSERLRIEQANLEAAQLMLELQKERELRKANMQFNSMVTHDIRNPLTTMRLATELLLYRPDAMTSEERQIGLETIQEGILQLDELVQEILMQHRMTSTDQIYTPTALDFVEFCNAVIQPIQSQCQTHHIIYAGLSQAVTTRFDPRLMRRALENLINNAIKYSANGTDINIQVQIENDQIIFSIEDQGIGIPEADQKQLFTMFHRAENAQHIRGTGIGLANVKEIIEHHNGTIHIDSQVNRGTKFSLYLPISTEHYNE